MTIRIGVISDTHGLLRPDAARLLAGVEHILHAGDIGAPDIIPSLRAIAPVTAIRGNVDGGHWANTFPETDLVRIAGRTFYLIHDIKALRIDPVERGIDAVICGHTHSPKIETVDGVLSLNPGSAGQRRFKLPITLATIEIASNGLKPTIHNLNAS